MYNNQNYNRLSLFNRIYLDVAHPYSGYVCIAFSYHMYGYGMGDLTVTKGKLGDVGIQLWKVSGNQGGSWQTINIATYVEYGEQVSVS